MEFSGHDNANSWSRGTGAGFSCRCAAARLDAAQIPEHSDRSTSCRCPVIWRHRRVVVSQGTVEDWSRSRGLVDARRSSVSGVVSRVGGDLQRHAARRGPCASLLCLALLSNSRGFLAAPRADDCHQRSRRCCLQPCFFCRRIARYRRARCESERILPAPEMERAYRRRQCRGVVLCHDHVRRSRSFGLQFEPSSGMAWRRRHHRAGPVDDGFQNGVRCRYSWWALSTW